MNEKIRMFAGCVRHARGEAEQLRKVGTACREAAPTAERDGLARRRQRGWEKENKR